MHLASRLILTAVAPCIAAGCGRRAAPKSGGTLTYAVTAEPPSTDCHAITTYAAVHVLAPHYSLLLKVDPGQLPQAQARPGRKLDRLARRTDLHVQDPLGRRSSTTARPLTSKDVKATFDRLRAPPAGIVSIRQALFADIVSIEAPDPTTVVMKLKAPDASFLDTLALPYNCVYSADQLAQDANFPAKTVMGSGPFVFVEHRAGSHWIGKRFDKYWEKGKPYLDGFRAVFIKSTAVVTALQGGQIQAEFRSISPGERAQLAGQPEGHASSSRRRRGCARSTCCSTRRRSRSTTTKVRQALSMAIDRWGGSEALSKITIVKPVGGPLLPGSPIALTNDELAALPGFGRDAEKSRAEAKKLLAEAGAGRPQVQAGQPQRQSSLHAGRRVRDRPVAPHRRHGRASAARRLASRNRPSPTASTRWRSMPSAPTPTIAKPLLLPYLSKERSPRNMTRNKSPELDALYDKFNSATDPKQRAALAAEMQRMIITEANSVPVIWYSRLVAHVSQMKGWKIMPTHFANQDLADVWLDQ